MANPKTFSFLPNFVQIKLPNSLAVVCHDAGAANLIINWLEGYSGLMRVCMGGPAAVLWAKAYPNTRSLALAEALNGAATLLSGTGWSSDLEYDARKLARAKDIKNIAVIDHWVNYKERFERHGVTVLPDEVWVTDDVAATEVRRCFPGLPVEILPNSYLESLLREVATFNPGPARRNPKRILYVLEPIRAVWDGSGAGGEFQALAYFLDNLSKLGISADVEIRLRPHPSDPPGKYDVLPLRYSALTLTIDSSRTLAEQIAWADWVVGCETFALVIALHANKIALSSLPPGAPRCRLPQRELLHLQEMLARTT